jgi:hypothetical protein
MFDMVRVADLRAATGESASLVALLESSAESRRDGSGLPADVEDAPVGSVSHDHLAGIASDPSRRFGGNPDEGALENEAQSVRTPLAGRRFRGNVLVLFTVKLRLGCLDCPEKGCADLRIEPGADHQHPSSSLKVSR